MSIFHSDRPVIPIESLEKSAWERFFSIISVLIFLGSIVFLVMIWGNLPGQVPAHFDAGGEVTRLGSKWELVILPLIGALLYVLLHVLEKYPHVHNFPIEITEANAEQAYRISRSLLGWLKNIILVLFTALMLNSVVIAMGWAEGMGMLLLPLTLLGTMVPIAVAIVKLMNMRAEEGSK
ncbi:hypothetical protein CR205_13400 [Alteribacter lacisalsi]|jgi:uncharacterized membrane protein|uniref:DUF1648 domain-containing protein n=1 Tax=Alteribacter lacisalsi TaxID=2045244 RepID=A0A2W0HIR0_9BACI|nr:DUF1648 domain-containing protein [Alteribacter lacisalsi]PYZ96689.1 hypothetical protein CR205_13400 [Alteribacter lacisalsi]